MEFGYSSTVQMFGCRGHALRPLVEDCDLAGALEEPPSFAKPRQVRLGLRPGALSVAALQDGRMRLAVAIGDVCQHLVPGGLLRKPDGLLRSFLRLTATQLIDRDSRSNERGLTHSDRSPSNEHNAAASKRIPDASATKLRDEQLLLSY
jgi:hypothetical protein